MKKRTLQLDLFDHKTKKSFGGSAKSHPKVARPLCSKRALHLVMRSRHAMGPNSFLARANSKSIPQIIRKQAQRFGVRIYDLVLVGNHLHAMIRISNPRRYKAFIRAISGLIARHVLKRQRGSASDADLHIKTPGKHVKKAYKKQSFWDGRPYTRILDWGRDYLNAKKYLIKNRLEAIGFAVEIRIKPQAGVRDLPLLMRI